jgi:hypothetical protein
MKSSSQTRSRSVSSIQRFKRTALASACALALGGLAMQSAQAQFVYTLPLPGPQTATPLLPNTQYIRNLQNDSAATRSATISNVNNGVFLTTPVVGANSSQTVTTNSSIAQAIGDLVTNIVHFVSINPASGVGGIQSGQLLSAGVAATSISTKATQTNILYGVQTTGQPAAVITVSGNTELSQTQLNQSASLIEAVQIAAGSVTAGSISTTNSGAAPPTLGNTTGATLAISSNQTDYNAGGRAGSTASITTGQVTLDLKQGPTQTQALTLSNNSIATTYGANSATNSIDITAGTFAVTDNNGVPTGANFTVSPNLAGSLAVSNVQNNIEDTGIGAAATALVTGSQINADVRARNLATTTTLSAPLVVTGNTLSALSTGNAAGSFDSAGNVVAGNTINVGSMATVTGTGSTTTNTLTNTSATAATATVGADFAMLNEQRNQGTYLNSQVVGTDAGSVLKNTQSGVVTADANLIGAGGSINLNNNKVLAGSLGNLAGSEVDISATTNLNGSAAVANSQVNSTTNISGSILRGSVTVNVGAASGPVTGTITETGNDVLSSAGGNVAANTVNVDSVTNLTSLVTPGGASTASANTTGSGSASVTSGTSVTSLQANYGLGTSTISSSVDSTFIGINARDQVSATTPVVPVSAGMLTLTGNQIGSSATGNNVANVIGLSGDTNATAQASIANTQLNQSAVSGTVTQSGITVNAGNLSAASTVTVGSPGDSNTVTSTAQANDGSNTIDTSFTNNLTVGPNPLLAGTPSVTVAGGVATSSGAIGIASSQSNTGSISSLTQNTLASGAGGSFVAANVGNTTGGLAGGVSVTNSSVAVSFNTVSATTGGNRIDNTLALTNITTTAGAATNIASIANSQDNTVTGVANATVDGGDTAVTGVGITYYRSLSGATLAASNNDVTATSTGNDSTNSLTANLVSLSSGVAGFPTGTVAPATGTVQDEFSLANVQSDAVSGGRTAKVTETTVGISNPGGAVGSLQTITGPSSLTVSDNTLSANATNNVGTNTIGLNAASTLSTSAGLLNQQSSSTNVTANVDDSRIRIKALGSNTTAGAVTGTDFVMDTNVIDATAKGSDATNTLSALSGQNLVGNATNTTSGVTLAGVVPTVTADFALANNQSQTGTVTATTTTPIRMVMGTTAAGNLGTTFTDGHAILSNSEITASAQATNAVNTLVLNGTSSVSSLSGAIGSGQSSTGAVSATIAPEPGGIATDVVTIEAASFTNTPVSVTGNTLTAKAGQNKSSNVQVVTGATISGSGLASSTDFSVVNAQSGTGAVSAAASTGQLGVITNSVTNTLAGTTPVTVSGNDVTASANVNDTFNGLGIGTSGSTIGTTSGAVVNNQTALTGAVLATLGTGTVPASVGLAGGFVGGVLTPPILSNTSVVVTSNDLTAESSRSTADNVMEITGATIAGGTGSTGALTQSFITSNTQTAGTGTTTSTGNVGVIGANATTATGTSLTVGSNTGSNTVKVTADSNIATNSETLSATTSFAGSAIVDNSQDSGSGALSATLTAGTIGLAGGALNGTDTVTVINNIAQTLANRNTSTNTLNVGSSSAAITGTALTSPASFTARNSQTGTGDSIASNTVTTIGATASAVSGAGNSVIVGQNTAEAQAHSNTGTTTVQVDGTSISGTGLAGNIQHADNGVVTATQVAGTVGLLVTGAANAVPVGVSGNLLNSEAIRNVGTTTMSADGQTISGAAPVAGTEASFSAISTQTSSGATVGSTGATNTATTIGLSAGSVTGAGENVVVSANKVLAHAGSNDATTALNLNGTANVTGSAIADSTQDATAAAGGSVAATVGVTNVGAAVTNAANSLAVVVSQDAQGTNEFRSEAIRNTATTTTTVLGGTVTGAAAAALPAGTPASFTARNNQTSGNATSENAGTTVGTIGIAAGSLTGTNSVVVDGDKLMATAVANSAGTDASLRATGTLSGTGMADSTQTATGAGGTLATVTSGTIGSTVAGAVNVEPVTVSNNLVSAQAIRNTASTTLEAGGAVITGDTTLVAGTPASFTARNVQTDSSTGGASATASVGTIGSTAGSLTGLGNSVAVTGNDVFATARSNDALTAVALNATSSLSGSAMATSNQTSSSGSTISANVNATTIGMAITGAANSTAVTVSKNVFAAEAFRNVGSSTVDATAVTVAGTAAASLVAGTPASFTALNTQTAVGPVTAGNTVGTIGATAASVTGTGDSFTVTQNTVSSHAGSNSGDTLVSVLSDNSVTGTAMADNSQTANGGLVSATTAATTVGVAVTGALATAPVNVSNNMLSSIAGRNSSTNTLDVEGITVTGDAALVAGTPASFTVRSNQDGSGNVTALTTAGLIGASAGSVAAGSTFGVVDNSIFALANVNTVKNNLILNAGSALGGTAQISNLQTSGIAGATAVSATVGSASPLTIGVTTTGALATSPTTVTGNVLQAQGGGNTATNALDAAATSTISATAVPTFAVLNTQNNAASVTTTVQFANIGVLAGSLSATPVTVSDNHALALSFGNSALNTVSVSALAGGTNASSSLINNVQTNSAAISASASNLQIGVISGSSVGGAMVVTNNSVGARAVGNSAVNIITAK